MTPKFQIGDRVRRAARRNPDHTWSDAGPPRMVGDVTVTVGGPKYRLKGKSGSMGPWTPEEILEPAPTNRKTGRPPATKQGTEP